MTDKELYDICHERYLYDPDTGVVTYKTWFKGLKKSQVGTPVGSRSVKGYLDVKIFGKSYRLHRIIWLMVTGSFPEGVIDHDNLVKDDNRWLNLKDTSQRLNTLNKLTKNKFNVVKSGPRYNVMFSVKGTPTYVCGFQQDNSLEKAQDTGRFLQGLSDELDLEYFINLIKRGRK